MCQVIAYKAQNNENNMLAASENTLNEIYQGLRGFHGSMKELSKRRGCTREWVRLVFKGDYVDNNLVKIAAELLLEKTQERAAGQQQIEATMLEVRAAQN